MLHTVPYQIIKAKRQVTLRHPNAYKCIAFRKTINRDAGGETIGGIPVLGGATVLSSEDEYDVDWNELGEGKVLFVDQFAASSMTDNSLTQDYANAGFMASIESLVDAEDTAGYFIPKKNDVVYLHDGGSTATAFEIVTIPSPVGIFPHVPHYELQKRDDLLYVAEF